MKIRNILLVAFAAFACATTSKAGTVVSATPGYGDGNVVCYFWSFSPTSQQLDLGQQPDPVSGEGPVDQYAAGTIDGAITTAGDPTLTFFNTINNDTSFAWTGYVVDIGMGQTFSILNPSVFNTGWAVQSVTQAPLVGGPFVGQIVFGPAVSPTQVPVQPGQLLSFSFQIQFAGSGSFSETLTPVPEPATASLLLAGGLLVGALTAAKRRQA